MTDWRPGVDRAVLAERARLLAEIRAFFAGRGVLEVDTPVLARYGVTDPAIEPLVVADSVAAAGAPVFLQSSPEYAMKRLLAAGSGAIYQLGKVFRDGEVGARHNPEFTLLEWYRPGWSLDALIGEVLDLVQCALGSAEVHRFSYRALFLHTLDLDPLRAGDGEVAAAARRLDGVGALSLDRDGWLDLLFTHAVEPALPAGLVVVEDYPPTQAALAQVIERDGEEVAARFELYVDGVEVANGYQELLDAAELRRRGDRDNAVRREAGQVGRDVDPRLLAAMEAGLPECSGVALGFDRLLMRRLGASRIDEVMPFAWERC